jgi:hypothetical protein
MLSCRLQQKQQQRQQQRVSQRQRQQQQKARPHDWAVNKTNINVSAASCWLRKDVHMLGKLLAKHGPTCTDRWAGRQWQGCRRV